MDSGKAITVGVLTPHATTGPEVELPDMAPGRILVEVSRIPAEPATAPGNTPEELRAQARVAVLDEAASVLLPEADVLAFASTGSGYALGYDAESELVEQLRDRWNRPFYSTCLSAVAALRSRNIERVSLVHPPWFGSSLNDLGAEYFRSQRFEVVDARLAELPDDPDDVQPAMVVDWIAQNLSPDAQAVFLGGNGFRAARAIHPLERRTGRLVLEANQVLLWSILRNKGETAHARRHSLHVDVARRIRRQRS